jgi:hypothetical protein
VWGGGGGARAIVYAGIDIGYIYESYIPEMTRRARGAVM